MWYARVLIIGILKMLLSRPFDAFQSITASQEHLQLSLLAS